MWRKLGIQAFKRLISVRSNEPDTIQTMQKKSEVSGRSRWHREVDGGGKHKVAPPHAPDVTRKSCVKSALQSSADPAKQLAHSKRCCHIPPVLLLRRPTEIATHTRSFCYSYSTYKLSQWLLAPSSSPGRHISYVTITPQRMAGSYHECDHPRQCRILPTNSIVQC